MSFEGYYRALCMKGHLAEWDCYTDDPAVCDACGSEFVWRELIDQTNGSGMEQRTPLRALRPMVFSMCNLGHRHVVEPTVYKIPKEEDDE
jgi:hypothetical protein